MVLEIFWKWELVFLKLKADGLEYDFDFSCSPEKWYHLMCHSPFFFFVGWGPWKFGVYLVYNACIWNTLHLVIVGLLQKNL